MNLFVLAVTIKLTLEGDKALALSSAGLLSDSPPAPVPIRTISFFAAAPSQFSPPTSVQFNFSSLARDL